MNFIRNLFFSWIDKEEAVTEENLPSTEPFLLKHDSEIRKKEINESRINRLINASKKENNDINILNQDYSKKINNKSENLKKSQISSPTRFKFSNGKEQIEDQTKPIKEKFQNAKKQIGVFSNANADKDQTKEKNKEMLRLSSDNDLTKSQISENTSKFKTAIQKADEKSNKAKTKEKSEADQSSEYSSSSDSDEVQKNEELFKIQPKIEFNYTSKIIKKIENIKNGKAQEHETKIEQKFSSSSDSDESPESENTPIAHPRIDFNFTSKINEKIGKLKEIATPESEFELNSNDPFLDFEFSYNENKTKTDEINPESETTSDSEDSQTDEKIPIIHSRIEFNDYIEKPKFASSQIFGSNPLSPETKLNFDFKSRNTTENTNNALETSSGSDSEESQTEEKTVTVQPRIDFDLVFKSNKATVKSKSILETTSSSDSDELGAEAKKPISTTNIQTNNDFESHQKIENTKSKSKSTSSSESDSEELPPKINFNYNFESIKKPEKTKASVKSEMNFNSNKTKAEDHSKKLSTSNFMFNIDLDKTQKTETTPTGFKFNYVSNETQTVKQQKAKSIVTPEFKSFNNQIKTQPVEKTKANKSSTEMKNHYDQKAQNTSEHVYNYHFDNEQSFEEPNRMAQFEFPFNHSSSKIVSNENTVITPSGFEFSFVSDEKQAKVTPKLEFEINQKGTQPIKYTQERKQNLENQVTPSILKFNSNISSQKSFENKKKVAQSDILFNHDSNKKKTSEKALITPSTFKFSYISREDQNLAIPKTEFQSNDSGISNDSSKAQKKPSRFYNRIHY